MIAKMGAVRSSHSRLSRRSLLLAAPKSDTNGATGLEVESPKKPHGLEGNNSAGAIIRRPCTGGLAVEVAAHYDDLMFEDRVGAGNVGDDVGAEFVIAGEPSLDVELEEDRDVVGYEAGNSQSRELGTV